MDCINCHKCNLFERILWKVECQNCQCPNYKHMSYVQSLMDNNNDFELWTDKNVNNSISQLGDYKSAMEMARSKGLLWLPIGLREDDIATFVDMFDDQLGLVIDDSNTMKRVTKIAYQMPIYDRNINISADNEVNNEMDPVLEAEFNYKKRRDDDNLGFGELEVVHCGENCFKCQQPYVDSDKFCVTITHSGTISWHVSCFQCIECDDWLADFHYYWITGQNNVLCMRHFDDISVGRCAGCDKLIFNTDCTGAMGKTYHVDHFVCRDCNTIMAGGKFIVTEDSPQCIRCYENKFTNMCDRCATKISFDSKDLDFEHRHWHEKCFFCEICKTSLVDQSFCKKETGIYCPDCYETTFFDRCHGCNNPFRSGMKKFEYSSTFWHEECFVCFQCKQSIGSSRFFPKDGKVFCTQCYDEKYALRCTKCKEVIRKDGVTYRSEPWHKACFMCTKCSKQLANIRFTSKDDRPYCPECFATSFSNSCKQCKKPIYGMDGCRFVTLEDDHWHSECFNCEKCGMNLVGMGYMKSNLLIMCARCGQLDPDRA